MKHKLRLEDLAVDTFATTPARRPARGTVRGFQDGGFSLDQACVDTGELLCMVVTIDPCDATYFGATCPADCGPTLEMSCGGSCGNYGGPCVGSDYSCGGVDLCY